MFDIKSIRPKVFQDVKGNNNAILMMKNFLKNNFPPFTVMVGEAGIGKTTLSKIIAKHLTCESRFNGLACEQCKNCVNLNSKLIEKNQDYGLVKTFKMSDEGGKLAAREIKNYLRMRVPEGKIKVVLIEECQGMSYEAQDLLLPELEYLPNNVKVIAMTTDSSKLQDTLLSRAIVFNMVPPTKEETIELLYEVCNNLGVQVQDRKTIPTISEYCSHRPRASLNTLHMLLGQGSTLNIEIVTNALNIVNDELYLEYLDLLRGDIGLVFDFINKLEAKEVPISKFVRRLNDFIIKLIQLRFRSVEMTPDMLKKCKDFLKSFDDNDLLKVQGLIAHDTALFREGYERYQFIAMSFKIANREDTVPSKIKSKNEVIKERQIALSNQRAKIQEEEISTGLKSLNDNPNALLLNTESFLINREKPTNAEK